LGIAAATSDHKIIVAGGLAATFAESISMAAVALTSKMAERDHYYHELERERKEIKLFPQVETEEIRDVYQKKGFSGKILDDIVKHITSKEDRWVEFMMKEELELSEVKNKEIYLGSFVVGFSALVGSFVPLTPYFFLPVRVAMPIALVVSVVVLMLVGIYKAKSTIGSPFKTGIQMVIIGMGAALAGYFIGHLFGQ
jgi:predicted membrane protein (TIGR00267 family)